MTEPVSSAKAASDFVSSLWQSSPALLWCLTTISGLFLVIVYIGSIFHMANALFLISSYDLYFIFAFIFLLMMSIFASFVAFKNARTLTLFASQHESGYRSGWTIGRVAPHARNVSGGLSDVPYINERITINNISDKAIHINRFDIKIKPLKGMLFSKDLRSLPNNPTENSILLEAGEKRELVFSCFIASEIPDHKTEIKATISVTDQFGRTAKIKNIDVRYYGPNGGPTFSP
jgi:hypothetical protein